MKAKKFFKALVEYIGSTERKEAQRKAKRVTPSTSEDVEEKPFKVRRHIGGVTIVVLHDGSPLSIEDSNAEIYNELGRVTTEDEVIDLFMQPISDQNDTQGVTRDDLGVFDGLEDFIVKGRDVYFNGVSLKMPDVVVAEFIEILESLNEPFLDYLEEEALADRYDRTVNFWLKLANSPVKDRDNILLFCKNNDIRLTRTGNIIAYRRVEKYKTPAKNTALTEFIKDNVSMAALWNVDPKNYFVNFANNEYEIALVAGPTTVGNLADLQADQTKSSEQLYTSAHSYGKYTFKIGDVYKMEGEEPDSNVGNCASGGLHGAAVTYNYSGFGEVPIVVLINPSKAIYVPMYETGKFRTTEMKVACINPNGHGVHIDEALIEKADEEYNEYSIDQLKEILLTKSFASTAIQEQVPEVTLVDIKNIVDILQSRVVAVA